MNQEIENIFIEDQKDRQNPDKWKKEYKLIEEKDRQRRKRITEMMEQNLLVSPEDYYHAAMVFQHGEKSKDYKLANELAKKSMDRGYEPAKWLFAASYDRWLVSQDKPQKYGTQFRYDKKGNEIYLPTDPLTTKEERERYNVPIRDN